MRRPGAPANPSLKLTEPSAVKTPEHYENSTDSSGIINQSTAAVPLYGILVPPTNLLRKFGRNGI